MNSRQDISFTLSKLPGFLNLGQDKLSRLESIGEMHRLDKGETIFLEGENSDNLYLLLRGQIALESYVPTYGNLRVSLVEPLDMFGWSSITQGVRLRTALARTLEAVDLISFNGKELRQLCDDDHEIGYAIMRRLVNVMANRLLTTRLQLYDVVVRILQTGE